MTTISQYVLVGTFDPETPGVLGGLALMTLEGAHELLQLYEGARSFMREQDGSQTYLDTDKETGVFRTVRSDSRFTSAVGSDLWDSDLLPKQDYEVLVYHFQFVVELDTLKNTSAFRDVEDMVAHYFHVYDLEDQGVKLDALRHAWEVFVRHFQLLPE